MPTYYSSFQVSGEPRKFILKIKEKFYKGKQIHKSAIVNKILRDYIKLCEEKGLNPLLRIPMNLRMPEGKVSYFEVWLSDEPAELFKKAIEFCRKRKMKTNKFKLMQFMINDFIELSNAHIQEILKNTALDIDLYKLQIETRIPSLRKRVRAENQEQEID